MKVYPSRWFTVRAPCWFRDSYATTLDCGAVRLGLDTNHTIKSYMRKVTQDIVNAFTNRVPRTIGNSHTDGVTLFLHGNAIARHGERGLEITLAGWNSNTTRVRLNGLSGVRVNGLSGVRVNTKLGQAYLNGKPWDGEWVTVSDWK